MIPRPARAALMINPPDAALPLVISGMIVNEDETILEIKSELDDSSVILNLEAKPYIVDCVTGEPAALKDRTGDRAVAYYGPVETRSLPPRSNPIVIILNVPEDFMPPRYGRAEAVEITDDQAVVTLDGESLIVTIGRDAPISPYLTKNIVTIDNIEVSSDLLMWIPFIAMSWPAQATSQKTVLLGKAADAAAGDAASASIPVSDSISRDGITIVPLRKVAEAIGFAVLWDDATKSIALERDGVIFTVAIGVREYDGYTLEAAPFIDDGLTYVPLSFFADPVGAECLTDGDQIVVTIN